MTDQPHRPITRTTGLPRRQLLQGAVAGVAAHWAGPAAAADDAPGRKVLRVLFTNAETGFDPARISDLYSRTVTAHIFEALYAYDHLAPGALLKPLTADGLAEPSDNFRTWTLRVQRGIFFADDPAFGGKPRELTAADYRYALLRVVDPASISPSESEVLELGILGLREARETAIKTKTRFDYDRVIEGVQLVDSHTLRVRVDQPRPRLPYWFADSGLMGGVAREVVAHYGDRIAEHPVGTGPFRLKQWRRSSKIILERNPAYRDVRYNAHPAPDDAEGQALLARFKGRRLPMVDEVDISIINEYQPQWLSFLNTQIDALAGTTGQLPSQFTPVATPGGRLAPNLARRGVQMRRTLAADSGYVYFNMNDPVVGGMAPAQVALRRAISLAYDVNEEVRAIRRGQAVVAQSPLVPHTSGYDPAFKSEMGDVDPARANALLDIYGFADRNGDGWRERPDGSPLVLEIATEPEQIYRAYNELWQKCMKRVGIQVRFKPQQWAENLRGAEAGTLMMWMLGGSADKPDGIGSLAQLYGPQAGNQNYARFQLPAFDALYERMLVLPDGPERDALYLQAKRIAVAYMPYKTLAHRMHTDLLHPWVLGFRRPLFASDWFQTVDIDLEARQRANRP
jgi:ABC-type transport system substrate-binding protein